MGIRAALQLRYVPATGLIVFVSALGHKNARPCEGAGACQIANVLVLLVATGAGVLAAGAAFVTAGLCRMRRRPEGEQQNECGKNRTQH